MSRLKNLLHEIHRRSIWQVLSVYIVGGWVVLQVADTLAGALGLPDWSEPLALFLLIVGLPIVLATAIVQSAVAKKAGADGADRAAAGRATAGGAIAGGAIAGEASDEGTVAGEAAAAGAARSGATDAGQAVAGHSAPTDDGRPTGSARATALPAGRSPTLFTWRNAIYGGVLALALWGVVVTGWLLLLRPGGAAGEVVVGAEVIAVLPFTVSGDTPLTGEGMVDLLSASLDQVGPIRTIAPQTVLSRWERTSSGGRPDLAASLQIGRLVQAGSVLSGSIVSAGSVLRFDATLHTVTGEQLSRVQVSGAADAPLALVDSLSIALLGEIWRSQEPVPNLRISAISTRNLNAIRAYLDGVALYRRGEYADAVGPLTQAVAADSTFALAHLRLADTYGWSSSFPNDEERARRRAVHTEAANRFADRLPDRERSMARIHSLYEFGDAASARDSLDRFVQRYPDDATGWSWVGELRFHSYEGWEQEPADLIAPFERAIELDPTAIALFQHVGGLILALGDTASAQRFLAARQAVGDPDVADQRALYDALWRSETANDAVADLWNLGAWGEMGLFALAFRSRFRPHEVVDALDRLALSRPADSELQLSLTLLRYRLRSALGQLATADRLMREAVSQSGEPFAPWSLYQVTGRSVIAGIAGRDRLLPDPGPSNIVEPYARQLWLAIDALHAGDAQAARAHIETGRAQSPDAQRLEIEPLFGLAMGWARVVEGDTVAGLEAMETTLTGPGVTGRFQFIQDEPEQNALLFQLAAGLAAQMDTREKGIRLLSMPWVDTWEYEVLSHFHRARAMDAAGDADGARAEYAWFVDVMSDADPGLPVNDLVEQARTALARLGARGG